MPYKNPEDKRACQRRYYQRNLKKERERAVTKELNKRVTMREYVVSLKESTPCMDCKKYYPAPVMDFDHRPDEIKLFKISEGSRGGGMERLKAEIDKCDIVCSNCHRMRTWNRMMVK